MRTYLDHAKRFLEDTSGFWVINGTPQVTSSQKTLVLPVWYRMLVPPHTRVTGKPGQSKVQPLECPVAQLSGDSQKFLRNALAVHNEQSPREFDRRRRAAASS